MYGVEFALLGIYLAIGIATTASVDALAIAMIDDDVYGLPDNAPSKEGWESLLWKSGLVVVTPLVLAVCMGIRVVLWMGKIRTGIDSSIYPVLSSNSKI